MTPEVPILTIEHWDLQKAKEAGHPEVAVMGMFIDVAVLRQGDKILQFRNIRELKIEWERFKRDDRYAQGILRAVEMMIEEIP